MDETPSDGGRWKIQLDIVTTMEYTEKAKKKNKNEFIQIRLSEAEKKMVDQQAKTLGLTVSAYLRMLIYEKEAKPM